MQHLEGLLRMAYLQVATPLQQAKCELMAFPWTPDVLAMCNLLAAHAGGIADVKRSYEQLAAKGPGQQQMPFNCLLMPELASIQDRKRRHLLHHEGLALSVRLPCMVVRAAMLVPCCLRHEGFEPCCCLLVYEGIPPSHCKMSLHIQQHC